MSADCLVRAAVSADIPAIAAIYRHHVLHGLATFELDPPDNRDMARRHAHVLGLGLPYLVAELDGTIAGYAYAGVYRERPAYRYTVENSVYVHHERIGKGIGRALLTALIAGCVQAGRRQIVAVIGDSANGDSIRLHEKCGFRHIGTMPAVGYKFGRWVDSVLMQLAIGGGGTTPPR